MLPTEPVTATIANNQDPQIESTRTLLAYISHPCALLVSGLIYILDPQQGRIQFTPWTWQPGLVNTWHSKQRVIILKARQLGVSWLVAFYALWTAMYHEGSNVLLLSKREDEAKKLLSKCKFIYDYLPINVKPTLTRDNDTRMVFGYLNSEISALPSTEDAGRSESASLVIADEAAFHPYAEKNYGAYKPAVDAGGKLIIVSTANTRGDLFHKLWQAASDSASGNGFHSEFLKWDLRPGRDATWYQQQQAEYSVTPQLLMREYPNNPSEAFTSNTYCVFDLDMCRQALAACSMHKPIETRLQGRLKIWQHPVIGRKYVAGVDVAEGRDTNRSDTSNDNLDSSGMAVYDFQTLVHVADLHGQWPLDIFSKHVFDLGMEYGAAYLGIERNNHGHAVISKLRSLGYPNLYYHQDRQPVSNSVKSAGYGWPTNMKTKPDMETDLGAAISSGMLTSYDDAFWDEALSYVHLGNGRAGADRGCHDDRVLKAMIMLQVRRRYRGHSHNKGIRVYDFAVKAG